jgi:hypothetical protein
MLYSPDDAEQGSPRNVENLIDLFINFTHGITPKMNNCNYTGRESLNVQIYIYIYIYTLASAAKRRWLPSALARTSSHDHVGSRSLAATARLPSTRLA